MEEGAALRWVVRLMVATRKMFDSERRLEDIIECITSFFFALSLKWI